MSECSKNCKLNICKEGSSDEVAQFEQERQESPKYATNQFSSYLQTAHGQDLVDDEDKFDIVWEMPGDMAADEEIASDPVEQLRAMDHAQKSSQEILMQLHTEAEAK